MTCVNNAIVADGSVLINGGKFNIETKEGIKSDSDLDYTDSVGSVIINGGIFNINLFKDEYMRKIS